MNFSEVIKIEEDCLAWSRCGRLLASAYKQKLTVRLEASLEVVKVFLCNEAISYVAFSPDSRFVLASNLNSVHLYSLEDDTWLGRITEGLSGLVAVEWSADSKFIITTAEFNAKITFWSLCNKSIAYIRNPKCTGRGLQYNRDKQQAALVERVNCKDVVNILATDDWSLIRQVPVTTDDTAGIVWCPLSNSFVIWDNPLQYRLQVYTEDGRLELDYSAYEHQLGISKVQFSSCGELLAVASFDNKVRIFSSLTWSLVHELDHFHVLHVGDPVSQRALVFNEEDVPLSDLDAQLALELGGLLNQSRYKTAEERPLYLDFLKSDPKKGSVKIGVCLLGWSACNRYVSTSCDNLPNAVWVWDVCTLRLAALLLHKSGVKSMRWDPTQPRLAMVTGGGSLYVWTPLGCVIARVPAVSRGSMSGLLDLAWNPSGSLLLLSNKEAAVLCKLRPVNKPAKHSEPTKD